MPFRSWTRLLTVFLDAFSALVPAIALSFLYYLPLPG